MNPRNEEFDIRGELAAALTCWHRLTEKEAAEIVALVQQEREAAKENFHECI